MKNKNESKNRTSTKSVINYALHALSLVAILFLANQVFLLHREADFLNKQSLQFNGRTNNLEGCWKNRDFECPEDKYFDASQFMKDE